LPVIIWATFAFTCISGVQYTIVWMNKATNAEEN